MARAKSVAPKSDVPTLNLNGETYIVSELPEEARQQLVNLSAAEGEIKRLQAQIAIAQTAYNAYQQALVAAVPAKKKK